MSAFHNSFLCRLSSSHNILPFDCGNEDLNDFLLNESKLFNDQLITVTYILEKANQTLAFFSIMNDKISVEQFDDRIEYRMWITGAFPSGKHLSSYPAMKIARLGVHRDYHRNEVGTNILDYLKILFITNNRTGCRFLTVDVYQEASEFYLKNGFEFLTSSDMNNETRLMYFDLFSVKQALNVQ
jgi:hypothetical protein